MALLCIWGLINATSDLVALMLLAPQGQVGVSADPSPVLKTCFAVFVQNREEPDHLILSDIWKPWKPASSFHKGLGLTTHWATYLWSQIVGNFKYWAKIK